MNRSILSFNQSIHETKGKGRNFNLNLKFPSKERQSERLDRKFQELSNELERRTATVQDNIENADPSLVLVFEVTESISDFSKAAINAGMEWLGELDYGAMEPDDNFYIVKNNKKATNKIPLKLYLTLNNQSSLRQLLRLWKQYQNGETLIRGQGKFKNLFSQLKDIHKWDSRDRFSDTGIIEILKQELELNPEKINIEMQLWYRKNVEDRRKASHAVALYIQELGGSILDEKEFPEIDYHGLLAQCSAESIKKMIEEKNCSILDADQIMFFKATGQAMAPFVDLDEENNEEQNLITQPNDNNLPTENPVIALLDGVPMQNHNLLSNRLVIYDPENYTSRYVVDQMVHGTMMASIILHGDLEHQLPESKYKLYVRPIMVPESSIRECIPHDKLFVDVLHKAVLDIVNNEDTRSIRIINLSIGDISKPFMTMMSPEAKMLDYLSEKYNLLFLVSSGNYARVVELDMDVASFKKLTDRQKAKETYKFIDDHKLEYRILAPSESINAITTGSINKDYSIPINANDRQLLVPDNYPSIYSRFGGGYGRSIKPDCLNSGGRIMYSNMPVDSMEANLRPIVLEAKPGIKVAYPGSINNVKYSRGTSHANAMSSRMCSDLLTVLRNNPNLNIPPEYEAVALKAMFIHSCQWGDLGKGMEDYLGHVKYHTKENLAKWIGFGVPNFDFASNCTDQKVSLIGIDTIRQNEIVTFSFPLPPSLISQHIDKRLTITLAWMSPISNNGNYRMAKLSFNSDKDNLNLDISEYDNNIIKRGTVIHQVFGGDKASAFNDGDKLKIVVACAKNEKLTSSVKFALVATLEIPENSQFNIYQEVETRLKQQVRTSTL